MFTVKQQSRERTRQVNMASTWKKEVVKDGTGRGKELGRLIWQAFGSEQKRQWKLVAERTRQM